jgi:hypothetical protein
MSGVQNGVGVLRALGPGYMPPQGARALARELLRRGSGSLSVSAALVDEASGQSEIELTNDGGETAVGLRFVVAGDDGRLSGGSVGNLPPGASTTATLRSAVASGDVSCVWICGDAKQRLHVWSYDGKHKRLRKPATDEECFRLMYGGATD